MGKKDKHQVRAKPSWGLLIDNAALHLGGVALGLGPVNFPKLQGMLNDHVQAHTGKELALHEAYFFTMCPPDDIKTKGFLNKIIKGQLGWKSYDTTLQDANLINPILYDRSLQLNSNEPPCEVRFTSGISATMRKMVSIPHVEHIVVISDAWALRTEFEICSEAATITLGFYRNKLDPRWPKVFISQGKGKKKFDFLNLEEHWADIALMPEQDIPKLRQDRTSRFVEDLKS